jgi:hypothetical protein
MAPTNWSPGQVVIPHLAVGLAGLLAFHGFIRIASRAPRACKGTPSNADQVEQNNSEFHQTLRSVN